MLEYHNYNSFIKKLGIQTRVSGEYWSTIFSWVENTAPLWQRLYRLLLSLFSRFSKKVKSSSS